MLNNILYGDCLDKMKLIESNSIDLIYLDPPFFTEKVHTLKNRERTKKFSFCDNWGSNQSYAEFIKARIEVMHSLLKDSGSIFVHCDKNGEHIIRAILDHVFGENNFQSEIIWSYKRWSNSKKGLLPNHQNIYFYSKSKDFKFNTIYKPYSETTNIDQILQRRARDKNNKTIYERDCSGEVKNGDKKKGVPLSDVWDIPYLNPKAKERVGYPTQKPLLLLEQIIELVTSEEDIVLDPFCGSGTTCVAATLLNRNYIGIDESLDAVELSKERLANPIKTESNLLKKGRESYLNADVDALSYLQDINFNPVQRNKGIDAILVEQFEGSPILVRVQKKGESLEQAASFLSKAMKTRKSKKSFLIKTSNNENLFDAVINFDGMEVVLSPALLIAEQINKS
ncbi:MAG TPA: DNA methyltransferase [Marinospirillum sp.]|uniref:DNA-methyltransferase n=1 Tax=Marinospirillum sp. TaxID=2183934 RepID=UPI002B47BE84|nr:DNA methyltransferase [Marinospirillum sp.]HKM15146.1 DNA methyltransferase [Marinospirillum sp.]